MRRRRRRLLVSVVLLGGLCAFALRSAGAAGKPVVLFDEAHAQKFLAGQNGPLDLSGLAEVLHDRGFELRRSDRQISTESLVGVAALVISGPFQSLAPAEVDAVVRFVENGGRLCVMLHIGPPVGALLNRLQISISNGVIFEQENVIDDNRTNFRVKQFASHELTRGLQEFGVYGGWALLSRDEKTRVVAQTSPRAWIDLSGDGTLGDGDAVQAFGVAVTGELGRGRFVVFGDDAIFQNQFLKDGNLLLAKNLAAWLAAVSS